MINHLATLIGVFAVGILASPEALADATSSHSKLGCLVQKIQEEPYAVLYETPVFNPQELPIDGNSLKTMTLQDHASIKFWSFDQSEISERSNQRFVFRFTYSFQLPGGVWSTNTVTIDPKYKAEPGVMRIGMGHGLNLNLICELNE